MACGCLDCTDITVPTGAKGDTGATGPTGPAGATGASAGAVLENFQENITTALTTPTVLRTISTDASDSDKNLSANKEVLYLEAICTSTAGDPINTPAFKVTLNSSIDLGFVFIPFTYTTWNNIRFEAWINRKSASTARVQCKAEFYQTGSTATTYFQAAPSWLAVDDISIDWTIDNDFTVEVDNYTANNIICKSFKGQIYKLIV